MSRNPTDSDDREQRKAVEESSSEIANQTSRYSQSIGESTPLGAITDMAGFVRDAPPHVFYDDKEHVKFWYKMLEKPGWQKKACPVVDLWAGTAENIQRAAKHVQRPVADGQELVRYYGIVRFKEAAGVKWVLLPEGSGVDNENQTVVFIALEDIGPQNGFFLDLKKGQDVCIDGQACIYTPPTGGGLAIWMVLRI